MPTPTSKQLTGLAPRCLVAGAVLLGLLIAPSCHGGETDQQVPEVETNSLDDRPLLVRTDPPFSFVVTGHAYGRPGANRPRPSSTLVLGASLLWQDTPDFSMLLGDTVFGWQPQDLGGTMPFLRTSLPQPVFNVLGNHELTDLETHVGHFGTPWSAFDHGGCRMIVLDSESDPWLISGQQRVFLLDEIRALQQRPEPARACFLYSHKPVWAMTHDTVLTALLGNAAADLAPLVVGHDGPNSFARIVLPELRALAATVPVLCFAGDFGAFPPVNMHLFSQPDTLEPNLHYYGVGLGDDYRDVFLTVTVPVNGVPTVHARELLTGTDLLLSKFNHGNWLDEWFPHGLPASVVAILDS